MILDDVVKLLDESIFFLLFSGSANLATNAVKNFVWFSA